MGMDSYLYRTTKSEAADFDEKIKLYDEAEKEFFDFEDSINEKYPALQALYESNELTREKFIEIASPEDVKRFDELNNKVSSLEPDNPDSELYYWRKPWPLHAFIVQNFNKDKDDNCVRIYLTKENVDKIIEALKDGTISTGEYFDSTDISNTINVFENIEWDDDTVIFYFSWY